MQLGSADPGRWFLFTILIAFSVLIFGLFLLLVR
jgi:hypothetical protein